MAGVYTPAEYANMHFIYGECGGNGNAAARLYRERYPNAERFPDYRVFLNVHRSYAEGRIPGRVLPGYGGQGRPRVAHDDDILEHVENDPGTSVRAIERTLGIPKSTAHRILKRHGYHPYHYQRVHTLVPRDYERRVQFCQTMLQLQQENPNFLNCILWSDESTFHKDGFMNIHNLHSWSTVNPHAMQEDRSQYRFKINLWTGILNGQIIGPFELPETLSGEDYLFFLTNNLSGLLNDVPLATQRDMWLQNDGCPAHFALAVRNYLDRRFEGRWIGRRGPVFWPALSLDLNPLDLFYWGYLKEYLKCMRPQ